MVSLGFNPRKKSDKQRYADSLEKGDAPEPRQLRGTKKSSTTGFCWGRKEEYIAWHKYGIVLSFVAEVLAGLKSDAGYCLLCFADILPDYKKYLVSLPGPVESAYVSVFYPGKGFPRILKVYSADPDFIQKHSQSF